VSEVKSSKNVVSAATRRVAHLDTSSISHSVPLCAEKLGNK